MFLLVLIALGLAFWGRRNLEDRVWHSIKLRLEESNDLHAEIGQLRLRLLSLSAEFTDLSLRSTSARRGRFELEVAYGRIRLPWQALVGLRRRRVDLAELRLVRPSLITDDEFFSEGRTPGSAGASPPVDLFVRHLDCKSGRWVHEGTRRNVELAADELDVTGHWTGDGTTLVGDLAVRAAVRGDPLRKHWVFDVQSRFRWSRRAVELVDIRASADGVRIEGRSQLAFHAGFSMNAEGYVRGDLGRVRALLQGRLPEFSGQAEGPFEASAGPQPIRVAGRMRFVGARVDRFAAERATASVEFTPGHLDFTDIDASTFQGTVNGSVAVGLGEPAELSIDLTSRDVATPAFFDWLQVGIPLSGSADARVRLQGRPGEPASWEGEATFVTRAAAAPLPLVPIDAEGRVSISGGTLEITTTRAAIGATTLTGTVVADLTVSPASGYVVVEGETADAAQTQQATESILGGLGVALPEYVSRPLRGVGRFRAQSGWGGLLDLQLRASLASGALAGQSFDQLEVDLRVDEDEVALRQLRIVDGERAVVGSARLQRLPFRVREIDLEAEQLDLATLLALLQIEGAFDGRVSGRLKAASGKDGLEGSGELRLRSGNWLGEPFDEVSANVRVEQDRFFLDDLRVAGPGLSVSGSATLDQDTATAHVRVDTASLDVGGLDAVDGLELMLHAHGDVHFGRQRLDGELLLEGDGLSVGAFPLGQFTGEVDFSDSGVTARVLGEGETRWEVLGTLDWLDPELPLRADLRLRGTVLDLPLTQDSSVWTRLVGLVTLEGPLLRPAEWTMRGSLTQAELHLGAHRLDAQGDTALEVAEGRLEVGPLRLTGSGADLTLLAGIDLGSRAIDGQAQGRLDLQLLSGLLPEVRAAGSAAVDVSVDGTLDAPQLSGTLRLEDGRLRHLAFPHTFEQIELGIALVGSEARVEEFRALVGGGEIGGTGRITLGASGVEHLSLELDAANVRVALPEGFEGVYDGRLTLAGTPSRLVLSGQLNLLRALYKDDFDFGNVFGGRTREYTAWDLSALPENVAIDVEVRSDGNTWVRNDLADVEAHGAIRFDGTLRRPEVTGRIGIDEGGKIRFRGVTYTVQSGSLEFTDPEGLNPYIRLAAQAAIGTYRVTLRMEGTLDEIDYELSSNPSLSQQDIIALLTTGKTLQQLGAGGAGGDAEFTGDLAASYFAGALTDQFERQLQRALGLDVLQINPLLIQTTDPTTRVTVGKKVGEDVLVIVSAELGSTEDELYQVEWQAHPKVRVTVERAVNGGLGSDILYTDRFWWKKPGKLQAEAVPVSIPRPDAADGGAPVGRISVEGVGAEEAAQLTRVVPFGPGDAYRRSTVFRGVEAIRRYYVAHDRLKAKVGSRTVPGATEGAPLEVVYVVDPGPEFAVQFEGLKQKEERRMRSQLERVWAQSLFTEDLFGDSVEQIREELQGRGFYAADVRYARSESDEKQSVVFIVDRGKAVRVAQVNIVGASGISEERVRKQMLTRPPAIFSDRVFVPTVLEDDVRAIRNLYWDQGFLAVRIEQPGIRLNASGERLSIEIRLDEGPRFLIRSIDFPEGLPFEELPAWSGLEQGEIFSGTRLLEAESRLRRELDKLGYPSAEVNSDVTVEDREVALRFEIDPGPQMRLNRVRIAGNELTKDMVILRELRIDRGEVISREKLLRAQHRLYGLSVFRNVRIGYEPAAGTDPAQYDVVIEVEEDRPLNLTTGVGYNTVGGFRFGFTTSQDNLQGRARSLGFQGELSQILKRIQFLFRTPRIFGASVPGLANILWEREEFEGFTVQRRSTALRVDRRFDRRWRGFLRYNFQRVDLLAVVDPDKLVEEKLEDINLGDIGVAAYHVTLDSLLLPTKGNQLSLGVRVFAKPLLSEANFVKAQVAESHQWTFSNKTSFLTAFRVGFAPTFGQTEQVPISERFFAGGGSTHRGFLRDLLGPRLSDVVPPSDVPELAHPNTPVGGQAMLLFNQEFRFPLWRRLKGVLFFDAGNVYLTLDDFDARDLRYALGAGLRLETAVGPIRAEYGWKLDREPGESAGQFHLAIGTVY